MTSAPWPGDKRGHRLREVAGDHWPYLLCLVLGAVDLGRVCEPGTAIRQRREKVADADDEWADDPLRHSSREAGCRCRQTGWRQGCRATYAVSAYSRFSGPPVSERSG
jgi:hypothetical protein